MPPVNTEESALEQFFLTAKADSSFERLRRWAHSRTLWPFAFGGACCALEFGASQGGWGDGQETGFLVDRVPPEQADLLIVAGTITEKMAPLLKDVYRRMSGPKWVIALGACAASGGPYASYHVVQGIARDIPVDVHIPGCPPTPTALIEGVALVKERAGKGLWAGRASDG